MQTKGAKSNQKMEITLNQILTDKALQKQIIKVKNLHQIILTARIKLQPNFAIKEKTIQVIEFNPHKSTCYRDFKIQEIKPFSHLSHNPEYPIPVSWRDVEELIPKKATKQCRE